MKYCLVCLCLFLRLSTIQYSGYGQSQPKHFVFFSREREGIHDSAFYMHPGITGAQITYAWKNLEPGKGIYDLHEIEEDLLFLQQHGKKLWIQLQDVTFSCKFNVTPGYLLTDPAYHGGANLQYALSADGKPVKGGWTTRRWDPAVAKRFHLLLKQLAKQFDGRIEGINLPETAVDFQAVEELWPEGFTSTIYLKAIKKTMLVLRKSFRQSVPVQYANFMPGPLSDLAAVYAYARKIGLGVGGPDIKVYRPFQMKNSYPMIKALAGIVPTAMAVQEGNYSVENPQTGKVVTVPEILDFAREYLQLNYIFWCTEEPFYSKEVLPMLQKP